MSIVTGIPSGAPKPPPSVRWTLILGSVGAFMAALDIVVVSMAMPTLRTHLHASLGDIEWTINAYNLAFACLMLTGSALGDRFGRRRMYGLGLLLFAGASAWCALSTSAAELISARVLEGAGAAAVLPLTLALISEAFPPEKRMAAIGIWGGVTGLGATTGPLIGGALTQYIAWQWIFWINVPIGLAVAVLASRKMVESRGPRPQLDPLGLILVALGAFGLTWAAVRAPSTGWSSGEVIAGLVGGVALVGLFIGWELHTKYPMIPMSYFRSRGFATANWVQFFQFMPLVGCTFMFAQVLQVGLGFGVFGAGLRLLVWTGTPLVFAPIAGQLAARFGNKPFMIAGQFLQAAGIIWLAAVIHTGIGFGPLVPAFIVTGIGSALCFPTAAAAVTMAVPPGDAGVASGTQSALREIGGVFGIAILAAVFAAFGGSYAGSALFIHGWVPAMYVAAAMAGVGCLGALVAPGKAAVGRYLQSFAPQEVAPASPAQDAAAA
jgi:EmrB/QacA subfamily drug resistance transporter